MTENANHAQPQRLLFLSHASCDTEAAKTLKARLLASPDAQAAGLKVWLDVDDMPAGRRFQPEIEAAIDQAAAFAVVVGSKGLANWVGLETDVALARAAADPTFPFIPVLLGGEGVAKLTPFARQFHAVADPRTDEAQLARLLQAALGRAPTAPARLTDDPFPGLRAMTEEWSDRFFGRKQETEDVLAILRRHNLAVIVADSGAGKSSLAMAGVGAAWRGGALAGDRLSATDETFWHVVTMRPGDHPLAQLRDAVENAAKDVGRSAAEVLALRGAVETDPVAALRCGLGAADTRLLLIIDQAEELVTLTKPAERQAFSAWLEKLTKTAGPKLSILVTVRADYFNLLKNVDLLGAIISPEERIYRFRQTIDIAEIVRGPLRLAGVASDAEHQHLIVRLRRDAPDRFGDLALVQMTLYWAWRHRETYGGLLAAYGALGGVLGVLGHAAQQMVDSLSDDERAAVMPIFMRLLRLGDAGATRRIAAREEFSQRQIELITKLAGDDYGRLVQTSETTVEIAHEALITQWLGLHQQITDHRTELRLLGDVMEHAAAWRASPDNDHLAGPAFLPGFEKLLAAHPEWLSADETRFICDSQEHRRALIRLDQEIKAKQKRSVQLIKTLALVAVVLGLVAVIIMYTAYKAQNDANIAEERVRIASEASRVQVEKINELILSFDKIKTETKLMFAAKSNLIGNKYASIRAILSLRGDEVSFDKDFFLSMISELSKAIDAPALISKTISAKETIHSLSFSDNMVNIIYNNTQNSSNIINFISINTATGRELFKGQIDKMKDSKYIFSKRGSVIFNLNKQVITKDTFGNYTAAFLNLTLKDTRSLQVVASIDINKPEQSIVDLFTSSDDRYFGTINADGSSNIYSIRDNKFLTILHGNLRIVNAIFSQDSNRLVVFSGRNCIHVFETIYWNEVNAICSITAAGSKLSISSDASLIAVLTQEGDVEIIDLHHMSRKKYNKTIVDKNSTIILHDRSATFLIIEGGMEKIIDLETMKEIIYERIDPISIGGGLTQFQVNESTQRKIIPSSYAVSSGGNYHLLRFNDYIYLAKTHSSRITINRDGRPVGKSNGITITRKEDCLFHIDERKHTQKEVSCSIEDSRNTSVSNNGNALSFADKSGLLHVLSLDKLNDKFDPINHGGVISYSTMSNDGDYIFSASGNWGYVWSATSGRQLLKVEFKGKVLSAKFTNDGLSIAISSMDGAIKIYNLLKMALITEIYMPNLPNNNTIMDFIVSNDIRHAAVSIGKFDISPKVNHMNVSDQWELYLVDINHKKIISKFNGIYIGGSNEKLPMAGFYQFSEDSKKFIYHNGSKNYYVYDINNMTHHRLTSNDFGKIISISGNYNYFLTIKPSNETKNNYNIYAIDYRTGLSSRIISLNDRPREINHADGDKIFFPYNHTGMANIDIKRLKYKNILAYACHILPFFGRISDFTTEDSVPRVFDDTEKNVRDCDDFSSPILPPEMEVNSRN